MQLVAMGAQDVFLTGNPQITFFKVVYRRHTNFSKECIKQEFNGNPVLGNTVTCTLARNGDLVQEIYLKAKITETRDATHGANRAAPNTAADLHSMIKSVEVEIGGQKIDKHYAAWLDIYNELFEHNIDYLELMTNLAGDSRDSASADPTKTVYMPLRFWFNRNAGLALPLIALQYHEVKVLVELNKNTDLNIGNDSNVNTSEMCLLVNYVYLDTDERRRFAQVSHEYLIEQVQHTGVEQLKSGPGGKVDMNFNHPVKALFWTTDGANHLTDVKIQLNGHDRFSEQKADYFHLVQPYECGLGHTRSLVKSTTEASNRQWGPVTKCSKSNPVGMYSFCLKPGEHQPSGSCNFSRIDNARLNYTGVDSDDGSLYLFALNYNVLRIMSGMGGLTYSN